MTYTFDIRPAHAMQPFVRAHHGGVIFSTVFHEPGEHGLQLICRKDGSALYIPLTDAYRLGRVYSVRITPFDASEWMYRYRNGNRWVLDPHAFGVEKVRLRKEAGGDCVGVSGTGTDGRSCMEAAKTREPSPYSPDSGSGIESGADRGYTVVTACSCDPLTGPELSQDPLLRPLPPADWTAQLIYSLHVKGFTAARPDPFDGKGTFAGLVRMLPYLESLGVTAVELMPVYTPLPDLRGNRRYRTMQEALGAWPVSQKGDPMRDLKERPNYWGFGRGLYYALRPEFGTRQAFAAMVQAFHARGIRVLLQVYFEKGVQVPEQIRILRFYVTRFGIDGFRLLGHLPSAAAIAQEPALADTALFLRGFPFQELEEAAEAERLLYGEDIEDLFPASLQTQGARGAAGDGPFPDPAAGPAVPASGSGRGPGWGARPTPAAPAGPAAVTLVTFSNLISCGDEYQDLLRRFVKSDDYVMKDFLRLFLAAPEGHGILRSVTDYEGFTLADLVSYSERHNEENGEFGLDGRADNYSWNCGEEGPTDDPRILALRRKQVRNFLTLLMLSQGTPMLRQGDERCHSQGGNNNPYCQDNGISWVDWTKTPEREALTAFTANLAAFRRRHPVFRSGRPFQYIDYLGIGHPDVSLHGAEAWKPDLGSFSHSIGIAFCENYAEGAGERARTEGPRAAAGAAARSAGNPALAKAAADRGAFDRRALAKKAPSFVYVAVNMYWKDLSLALPKLPPHYVWKVFLDTEAEEGFLDRLVTPKDQHRVDVAPRSIRLLRAVPDMDAVYAERQKDRRASLPPAGVLRRQTRKNTGRCCKKASRKVKRAAKTLLAPKDRPCP